LIVIALLLAALLAACDDAPDSEALQTEAPDVATRNNTTEAVDVDDETVTLILENANPESGESYTVTMPNIDVNWQTSTTTGLVDDEGLYIATGSLWAPEPENTAEAALDVGDEVVREAAPQITRQEVEDGYTLAARYEQVEGLEGTILIVLRVTTAQDDADPSDVQASLIEMLTEAQIRG
jgi:hypothetical protein